MECNHDVNSPTTTIVISKKRRMVKGDKIKGVCSECGQTFEFKPTELKG
jgi:hypothetical protein